MKKALSVGILILLAIGASFVVYASNVSNTKHNMVGAVGAIDVGTANTTEVCVFCHTPHNSGSIAPLWNRTVGSDPGYNTYGNPFGSINNAYANGGVPSGVSRACLSCHDGLLAVDQNLRNVSPNTYNTVAPLLHTYVNNTCVSATGTIDGCATDLTTDLSNDHPISIYYDDTLDPDLEPNTLASVVGNWTGNTLPLFGSGDPYTVECASCHNVHDDSLSPFLRASNADSRLCLTCHNK